MSERISRQTEIVKLVEAAPGTLARRGSPALANPELFHKINDFDFYTRLSEDAKRLSERIKVASRNERITASNVSAQEMLTTALETPKNIHLTYGEWFLNTISNLSSFIAIQRFGRRSWEKRRIIGRDPASMFYRRTEKWRKGTRKTATSGGNLWEFGIIVENKGGNFRIFSISVPWDGTMIPWYEHLTPKRIFVGRERELDIISQTLTGKSMEEARVEAAFNSNDTRVWWGQANRANTILRGRFEEVEMRTRPQFYDRVIDQIKAQTSPKQLYDSIASAKSISGYYVTARKSNFPGAVDLELHLDSQNWLEPYPTREKNLLTKSLNKQALTFGLTKLLNNLNGYLSLFL